MQARPGGLFPARRRLMAAVAGLATAMALTALGAAPAAAAVHAASSRQGGGLVAATDDGKLQGKHDEGIDQFLGIPYAAPPVGALRWQVPQPVQPWPGIRSATSYGNRCAQLPSGNGPREDTEDCLYLNVFTPADYRPGRGGLPVMVMIHGGGLTTGPATSTTAR